MQKRYLIAATAVLLSLPLALSAAEKKKGGGFAAADKNGDGKVTEAEYVAAMTGEGKKMDEKGAKARFKELDTNNDKALSQEEYAAGAKKKKA